MTPFSAVVLAGGYSTRMGHDKARLQYQGQPLLAHQLQTLADAGAAEILVSCRTGLAYPDFGYPLVFDSRIQAGPLAGIEAALKAARNPLLVVLAVDLPKMTASFLRLLRESCQSGAGVVPLNGPHYEPLAAIYPRKALSIAVRRLIHHDFAMQEFVRQCVTSELLVVRQITPLERPLFVNWNRESDVSLA